MKEDNYDYINPEYPLASSFDNDADPFECYCSCSQKEDLIDKNVSEPELFDFSFNQEK